MCESYFPCIIRIDLTVIERMDTIFIILAYDVSNPSYTNVGNKKLIKEGTHVLAYPTP